MEKGSQCKTWNFDDARKKLHKMLCDLGKDFLEKTNNTALKSNKREGLLKIKMLLHPKCTPPNPK